MAGKVKTKSDAVMTGILITRYKMGLIKPEDLQRMALDSSKPERSSAAKRVLEELEDIW